MRCAKSFGEGKVLGDQHFLVLALLAERQSAMIFTRLSMAERREFVYQIWPELVVPIDIR